MRINISAYIYLIFTYISIPICLYLTQAPCISLNILGICLKLSVYHLILHPKAHFQYIWPAWPAVQDRAPKWGTARPVCRYDWSSHPKRDPPGHECQGCTQRFSGDFGRLGLTPGLTTCKACALPWYVSLQPKTCFHLPKQRLEVLTCKRSSLVQPTFAQYGQQRLSCRSILWGAFGLVGFGGHSWQCLELIPGTADRNPSRWA